MEYSFDEPELSDFVTQELNKVTKDINYMGNSERVLSMFKHMSNECLDDDHWSQTPLIHESVEQDHEEHMAHSINICLDDESEHLLFLEPEPVSQGPDDTKILIQLDQSFDDDLQCSEKNGEDYSNESVAVEYAHPQEDQVSECDNTCKGAKIQVINSHNLKRNDVILKSILRSMRRYFCKNFLSVTKFKKTEKQQKIRRDNLIRCANELIDQMDLPKTLKNFPFYYMALAYPGELKKVLNEAKNIHKQHATTINHTFSIVKLIENVLNRFSKRIFSSFMEIPEIAVLVQHFLTNNSDQLERIEGFENCVVILQEKAQEVINQFIDDSKYSSDNSYWMKKPLFIFAKNNKKK